MLREQICETYCRAFTFIDLEKKKKTHTHTHTHTHIYIYIYTHTHIYICAVSILQTVTNNKIQPPKKAHTLPKQQHHDLTHFSVRQMQTMHSSGVTYSLHMMISLTHLWAILLPDKRTQCLISEVRLFSTIRASSTCCVFPSPLAALCRPSRIDATQIKISKAILCAATVLSGPSRQITFTSFSTNELDSSIAQRWFLWNKSNQKFSYICMSKKDVSPKKCKLTHLKVSA